MKKTFSSLVSPKCWLLIGFLLFSDCLFSDESKTAPERSEEKPATSPSTEETYSSHEVRSLEAASYALYQFLDEQDSLATKRKNDQNTMRKEIVNVKLALTKLVLDDILSESEPKTDSAPLEMVAVESSIANHKDLKDEMIGSDTNLAGKNSGLQKSPVKLGSNSNTPKAETLDTGIENLPKLHEVKTESAIADHQQNCDETIGADSNLGGKERGMTKYPTKLGSKSFTPKSDTLESGIENLPKLHEVKAETRVAAHQKTKDADTGASSKVVLRDRGMQKSLTRAGTRKHEPARENLEAGIENLPRFNEVQAEGTIVDHQPPKPVKSEAEEIGPSNRLPIAERGIKNRVSLAGSRLSTPKRESLDSGIANLPRFNEVKTETAIAAHQIPEEVKVAPETVGAELNLAGAEEGLKATMPKVGARGTTPKLEQIDSGIANLPRFDQVSTETKVAAHQSAQDAEMGPSTLVSPMEVGMGQTRYLSTGSKGSSPKKEFADLGIENSAATATREKPAANELEELVADNSENAAKLYAVSPLKPTPQSIGVDANSPAKPALQPVTPTPAPTPTAIPLPAEPTTPTPTPLPIPPPVNIPAPAPEPIPAPVPPPPVLAPAPAPAAPAVELPKTILAPSAAPAPAPAAPTPQNTKGYLINFNNVSIIEYIRFISKITNKNFIFEENELQFNVTIVSEEATSIENMMAALMQELRIHNLSMIEQGNNLIIHTNKAVNSPGKVTTEQLANVDLETRVFFLTTLDPEKTVNMLKPLLSPLAIAESIDGNLVVTDITANVNKVSDLVKSLDSSTGGYEVGQYLVQNSVPDALIALAEQIMTPLKQNKTLVLVAHNPTHSVFIVAPPLLVQQTITVLQNLDVAEGRTGLMNLLPQRDGGAGGVGGAGGGLPGQNRPLPPGAVLLPDGSIRMPDGTIVPPSGTETLSTPGLTRNPKWAESLPLGHPKSTEFLVHKLHYRKGDQIEVALQRIADALQQTGISTDMVTTIRSSQWIESSNSLVFTGTHESLEKVKELIDEMDVALRQVYLEVLILDTTIDNSLNFSIDWAANAGNSSFGMAEDFLSAGSPVGAIIAGNEISGPVTLDASGLTQTSGFNLGVIGRHITHGGAAYNTIGALVKALHTDTTSDIILNPKLIVEDNTPAEIFVGINAPFRTQSFTNELNNVITNNFQYEDIGARFKVTPFLGTDDIITLQVDTSITSVAGLQGTSSITGAAVTIAVQNATGGITTLKSTSSTRLHVPNDYFVMMNGMIEAQTLLTSNQVPCLGSVPVVGSLFGNKSKDHSKRNLMMFIRPHIIDHEDEYDQITKRNQDMFKERNRVPNSWKFQIDGALEWLNLDSATNRDVDCP